MNLHLQSIEKELSWLKKLVETRFALYFGEECGYLSVREILPPRDYSAGVFGQTVLKLDFEERLALALCIAAQVRPKILDIFFTKNQLYDKNFTEFGGIRHEKTGSFTPTLQSLVFLLDDNTQNIWKVLQIFDKEAYLRKNNILDLDNSNTNFLDSVPRLSTEYWQKFLLEKNYTPTFEEGFAAQALTTSLNWEDLIVEPEVLEELEELSLWIKHSQSLLTDWALERRIAKGYRALFYGAAGTGKTLTASLLGKSHNLDVYRIDLSLMVSKYIGETEKNLAKVFAWAENRNWILFFDEADAIFGKRTQTKDAQDRYSNQEVSYLLQRIENFDGIIILATNLKANLDEAFIRRFQSVIYFAKPDASLRLKL